MVVQEQLALPGAVVAQVMLAVQAMARRNPVEQEVQVRRSPSQELPCTTEVAAVVASMATQASQLERRAAVA